MRINNNLKKLFNKSKNAQKSKVLKSHLITIVLQL